MSYFQESAFGHKLIRVAAHRDWPGSKCSGVKSQAGYAKTQSDYRVGAGQGPAWIDRKEGCCLPGVGTCRLAASLLDFKKVNYAAGPFLLIHDDAKYSIDARE